MSDIHTVYLGLGSNIGDKRKNIADAICKIGESVGDVIRQSTLYETEPWGFASPNMFINAAVCVETKLSPHQVLSATQAIERELGRTYKSVNKEYHDRTIDIDILLYDDLTMEDDDLVIPHPLMQERDFVMKPLSDILVTS